MLCARVRAPAANVAEVGGGSGMDCPLGSRGAGLCLPSRVDRPLKVKSHSRYVRPICLGFAELIGWTSAHASLPLVFGVQSRVGWWILLVVTKNVLYAGGGVVVEGGGACTGFGETESSAIIINTWQFKNMSCVPLFIRLCARGE